MVSTPKALERLRPAWARVDLDRLAANYRAVADAAKVPLLPVVKAEAYGHGAARVALHLQALGASMLAVALVEEGVALRAAGVTVPILVLAGFGPGQAPALLDHGLTPVVSTAQHLEWALRAAHDGGRSLAVHAKVDTGMTRLGFAPAELGETVIRVVDSGHLVLEGVLTHLAAADEDPVATEEQLDRFDAAVSDLARRGVRPRYVHAAASAGLPYLRPSHNLVRPGLLLYGLRPRPRAPAVEVRPVMTLAARISLVRDVPAGTAVSYGGRWVAPRPSRIAVVPLGYADGVPRTRRMEEAGALSVAGRRAPVTGTVCMDSVMIDVTDHPQAKEGDEAVVFGDDPTAWDVADWAGTNAWQVLTAVGARVPRVYLEGRRVVDVEARYG
jgi:alanine racemase